MPDALSGHAGGHLAADRGRIRRKIADYILGCRYAGRSHPVPDTDGAGASDGARLHILENGLCELHGQGLKPTEGCLSYHVLTEENLNFEKSLTWNVAKEWINTENISFIARILQRIVK